MEQHSVVIAGLANDIDGVNFTAGTSVYYDATLGLNQSSTGEYFGYATGQDSMIVRPDFVEYPTVKRKYEAEGIVNNKMVQIDNITNKVSSLPLKTQGVAISDITNTITGNLDKTFIDLKDNIILCVSYNSTTYKGYLQLYQYSIEVNNITQLGSDTLFSVNKVIAIKKVCKLSDNKFIIIFNDNDGTNPYTYAMVGQVDYNNTSFVTTTPLRLDDYGTVSSYEYSYLLPVSENKIIHIYHDNVISTNGATKGQIINYDPIANTLSKTTSYILQSNIGSPSLGELMQIANNKFVFTDKIKKDSDGLYYLTNIVFSIDSNDLIVKLSENNMINNVISLGYVATKKVTDNKFLIAYMSDSTTNLCMSVATLNTDDTVTVGAKFLNKTSNAYMIFDDTLDKNLFLYAQSGGILNCVQYSIDSSDNLTFTTIQSTGSIVAQNKIFKVSYNTYLIISESLVKKITYTKTSLAGFYNNGNIYFCGYCPNVDATIINGATYYWNINGSYTLDSNGGNNPVLGLGLNNGLYIMEKSEKIPSSVTYLITAADVGEIYYGENKVWTIKKYNNGTEASQTFTYSIDYMGNPTAMVTITASTSNTVTIKVNSSSYTNKKFTLKCTDTSTSVITTQVITIMSLW